MNTSSESPAALRRSGLADSSAVVRAPSDPQGAREDLIAEATAAVCGSILKDYRDGKLHGVEGVTAEEKLAQLIARRRPLIADYVRERMMPRKAVCCGECGAIATTHMGDADYCDEHARNHRMALPAGIGVAA